MIKAVMIYSTRTGEKKQTYMVDLEWSTEDKAKAIIDPMLTLWTIQIDLYDDMTYIYIYANPPPLIPTFYC